MVRKTSTSRVVWLRRGVQSAFLLLFFYLFLDTKDHPINTVNEAARMFLQLDPLAALTTFLASHELEGEMLLALVTLGVTLLFGRWFCGWVCPFGALHNFFTSLRRTPAKAKLDTGGYTRWQKAKYYILAVFLGGALLGANVAGWLDPIPFFVRSLGTSIYPAINDGIVRVFTWIYDVNPGIGPVRLTVVTEPIYDVLRKHFLVLHQPHYFGNVLIGSLFLAVVALNFFRARFWCRYICPLGALLGVVGKSPLVRFKRVSESCNNCRLCVAECQGGAAPNADWKPSECFYCFNCQSNCPSHAIHAGKADLISVGTAAPQGGAK
jgi:polyferredoxin